ncbi:MAG TPA: LrgB family protein [Sedimentisphaerales bacterium]|nr:LrgB family protein [Sedimentisphaerales bacterium]
MEQWVYHPWFGIILTVGIWIVTRWLRHRVGTPLLDPVMLTVAAIIAALLLAKIPFEAYNRGGQVLAFLLGPSVVALAVPFYRRLEKIKQNLVPILLSVLIGSITGIVSAVGLALLLGGSNEIAISLAPKSVTTPIAIGISQKVDGLPSITAAAVILTGILGGMFGPELIRLIGGRSQFAMGLAIGTAAHGIGTARALREGELEGALSGVGMMLNGLITAIALPYLLPLFL